MNVILLLARRELATYLNTWWGWVITAVILLLDGVFFNVFGLTETATYSAEVLEQFFFWTSGLIIIAGLLLTMRLLAEERQTGTLVLLESAPISEAQIVLGKFLGAWGFLMVLLGCTIYMPLFIMVNGKIAGAQLAVGYLGVALAGAASVAVGTFASAIARNQLLSIVLGALMMLFLVIAWFLARLTEGGLSDFMAYIAIWDRHFQPFMRGRVNTENIVYFGSVVFAFLLLATRALQARRWK